MITQSLVTTDIDFERDGKQFGNLCVPQSTNSSGWAKRYIPVFVIKSGSGPTAVLFGGNHGDEFEGPVTLMNFARNLSPNHVRGRIIIVPMLNRPAVEVGTRLSPLDGCNMNRAFPGDANDTITGMIAHYVSSTILPMADLVVDIHSGGSSTHFLPSVNMHEVADKEQMRKMIDAGLAWGAPYVFIYQDVAGAGLLPSFAEQMGKVTLGTEMGSKSQFGVETLSITARGIENVLAWAEIMQPPSTSVVQKSVIVGATSAEDYIMSPASGLFEPFYELGDEVREGTPIGQIHSIENPNHEPIVVPVATDGMLMARRANPLTMQGEMITTVVRPYELATRD